MSRQAASTQLTRYLAGLDAALIDAPGEAREEILADVRAHAEDAVEQGRSIEEVLAALGTEADQAAQYRSELGLPSTPPPDSRRATRILQTATLLVAVLTGILVAFLVPIAGRLFGQPGTSVGDLNYDTLIGYHGAWGALLAFAPALLALLPLVLPQPARMPSAVVSATAVAILAALSFTLIGYLFVPLVVCMWSAVVVPWRVAHGLDVSASPLWRIFGGVLIALPGLLLFSGFVTGAFLLTLEPILVAVAVLVVGALFAAGVRATFYLTAALGLATMIFALFDGGLSRAPIWWAGGAWLAIGLSAIATLRPRREAA